ncbi:hypothetical protein PW5551_06620 [Petrotoga sp. 9PW.55.5.1]|uniref:type VII toxin-antitoxin system HepT family RNase toxin n=1 Tax=unclassified Petrotoga TaxID=2620614 RepID=UPI000CA784E7|nr:hypothetical protein X925_04145 [Petrotoga sp. 9T1HF07.CasAA.8.2]RAO98986.1 hypothetical protein PW5551_06620 [Petrotoga sp. 9PW.55.5.1]
MINKDLIRDRLLLINKYISQLEMLSQFSKEEFLSDSRNPAAAESFLRRSLESIFDIGRHILAKIGNIDMAGEYKAIATGLGEKDIVSEHLSQKLIQMAGYRNRLVHLYHNISEEELYDIVKEDLKDLEQFVICIEKYLENN